MARFLEEQLKLPLAWFVNRGRIRSSGQIRQGNRPIYNWTVSLDGGVYVVKLTPSVDYFPDQQIGLVSYTQPPLGGTRYALLCPRCKRRVRDLYFDNVPDGFACRCCLALTYRSSALSSRESSRLKRLDEEALARVAQAGGPVRQARVLMELARRERKAGAH